FFSSRRRHTRFDCDWSSDVCSSDLEHTLPFGPGQEEFADEIEEFLTGARRAGQSERVLATVLFGDIVGSTERAAELGDSRWRQRSEERRVGKECRCVWGTGH